MFRTLAARCARPALATALVLGIAGPIQTSRAQEPDAESPANPPGEGQEPAPEAAPAPREPLDPNPFRFGKDPRDLSRWTTLELWDAVDYLVRIRQPDEAARFLRAFLGRKPDDATLLAIRDRYGYASILRLQDTGPTGTFARPMLNLVAEAARREATRPENLRRYIAALSATPEEQAYAVERLREARSAAVPPIVRALGDPALSKAARALVVANLGALNSPAVPPLIASLESPDPDVAAAAAEALGRIGDPRAVPFLYHHAARAGGPKPLRDAARSAIARLQRRPYSADVKAAARVLADEARRYLVGEVGFPDGPFETWAWQGDAPAPRGSNRAEAESYFGEKLARQTLDLDPGNRAAKVVLASFRLLGRGGPGEADAGDPDPAVLAEVIDAATARGDGFLGAAAVLALAKQTKPGDLASGGRVHPLVRALDAPSRRIRIAAAKAIVDLDPKRPFAGSGRLVPVLIQFIASRPAPTAVVVDGNTPRANQVASVIASIGYDTQTAATAEEGFRLAAESADVEAVLIEPSLPQGSWNAPDLLANLRADARTARLPVYLLEPEDLGRIYARASQLVARQEAEDNDTTDLANPLFYTAPPRQARVVGVIPKGDPRGDVFAVGRLRAGDAIVATPSAAMSSAIEPADLTVSVEGEGDAALASETGGRLAFVAPSDGRYFLRVTVPANRRGFNARYLLDVYIGELNAPPMGTEVEERTAALAARFPRVAVLATPYDSGLLRQQFLRERARMGAFGLGDAEREAYARAATEMLAKLVAEPASPFAPELASAADALALAVEHRPTGPAAIAAMAELPSTTAQRDLADAVIDVGLPLDERRGAAEALVRSIKRFGPLVTAEQERSLYSTLTYNTEPEVHDGLTKIIEALLPRPERNVPASSARPPGRKP